MATLNRYYYALSKLKNAQKNMNEIYTLENCLDNYERYTMINYLSNTFIKHQKEINIISKLTQINKTISVTPNEAIEEYDKLEKSDEDIKEDANFAINCLLIIFAVYAGIAPSYDEAIKDLG